MKTLVIYTHPNPASFNAAIKETVVNELTSKGHEVKVRDLYAMNFNPILSAEDFIQFSQNQTPEDIIAEQDAIAWADQLVFIYPMYRQHPIIFLSLNLVLQVHTLQSN